MNLALHNHLILFSTIKFGQLDAALSLASFEYLKIAFSKNSCFYMSTTYAEL